MNWAIVIRIAAVFGAGFGVGWWLLTATVITPLKLEFSKRETTWEAAKKDAEEAAAQASEKARATELEVQGALGTLVSKLSTQEKTHDKTRAALLADWPGRLRQPAGADHPEVPRAAEGGDADAARTCEARLRDARAAYEVHLEADRDGAAALMDAARLVDQFDAVSGMVRSCPAFHPP